MQIPAYADAMVSKPGIWLILSAFVLQSCAGPVVEPVVPPPDCAQLQCVALTFDGGPDGNTAEILDILVANGARATFFVIGKKVAEAPELVARMVAEGHEIGNHSWSHVPFPRLTEPQILAELATTNRAIAAAADGYEVKIFRPPFGSYSPRVAAIVPYAPVLWNVDANDWRQVSSAEIARQVGRAKPGMIILMHSFVGASVRALPEILRQFRARGFTLVTVSEL